MRHAVQHERHTVGAMPVLVVRPETAGQYPVVVGLHGLTGRKEDLIPLAEPLAATGYIVALPDARFHGERFDPAWMQFVQQQEGIAVAQSIAETAAELPALVDMLLARDDARGGEVGIMGVSMGALTLYNALPREPRFTVAVSLIGGGIFTRPEGQTAHLPPDARALLEANDVRNHLAEIARVTLLFLAGRDDTRLPVAMTQALYDALRPHVPAAERLALVVENGIGHEVTPAMGAATLRWFHRWLPTSA